MITAASRPFSCPHSCGDEADYISDDLRQVLDLPPVRCVEKSPEELKLQREIDRCVGAASAENIVAKSELSQQTKVSVQSSFLPSAAVKSLKNRLRN